MKIKSKIKYIGLILILIFNFSSTFVNASFKIDSADLYSKGLCQTLLIDTTINSPIVVNRVFYMHDGKEYPAYCVNRELVGATVNNGYSVSVEGLVNDSLVWRVITNGYPYKSLAELGVASEDEAYTATKQAVYCVIYGNDANNYAKYKPVGEAGNRTLNAMKNIVSNARNSSNVKASSDISVNLENDWKIDSKDKNYISREFYISAAANLERYSVKLSGDLLDGVIVSDLENNKKDDFGKDEKFKVLIPIKSLEKDGTIKITVNAEVETKPILYGKSSDPTRQNYALVADVYETGEGNAEVKYNKNTSKIIINKIDKDTKDSLEGAEFNILDENMNVIYNNLRSNDKGIIEVSSLIPGTYYIEETKAPDGYEKYEEKYKFVIGLNEEVTVDIDNAKEIHVEKKVEVEKTNFKITKLPKTGM